jgi:hypothetical protein
MCAYVHVEMVVEVDPEEEQEEEAAAAAEQEDGFFIHTQG